MNGPFITFEGIDGCGKSSHLAKLARHLQLLGVPHLITFEPGGTSFGAQVRSLVLSQETAGMGAVAELMLYAADRAEHVRTVIGPALREGRLVLCDRFTDSSVAFQGYGRGLDLKLIDAQAQPERIRLIDSSGESDAVQERVRSEAQYLIDRLKARANQ
jgi:dTMP kinase